MLLKFSCGAAYTAAAESRLEPVDFCSYYAAAERLNHSRELYILHADDRGFAPYRYTPLVAQCFRPLAALVPIERATKIWIAANIGFLLLGMFLFFRSFNVPRRRHLITAVILILTGLRYRPSVLELAIGNVDAVLLALLAAMFLCVRQKRWVLVALLIALAAAVKTWCIALIGFLLLAKQWRAAALSALYCALLMLVLFASIGFGELPNFLMLTARTFYLFIRGPGAYATVFEAPSTHHLLPMSHSIFGIVQLYFSQNTFGVVPLFENHFLFLSVLITVLIALAGGLLLAALKQSEDSVLQAQLLLSLCALSMLMTVPVSHFYCMVLALPSLWILLVPGDRKPDRSTVVGFVGGFLCYLILSIPTGPTCTPFPSQFTHGLGSLRLALPFLSMCALWALTFYRLISLTGQPLVRTPAEPPL